MNPAKIIIHVGLQKTASTFLQNRVFDRWNDVAYFGRPYTQENHAFNTLQFADNTLYSESCVRKEFENFENIAGGKPILLPDELFSGFAFYNFINRGIIAERLGKLVPDAEIILFLRGQADLIVSLYNQYVKVGWIDSRLNSSFLHRSGQGITLDDWMTGDRTEMRKRRYINNRSWFSPDHFRYSTLYSMYKDLFKKVHVFLYEDFRNDHQACLQRLASIVSADLPPDLSVNYDLQNNSVNKSLTDRQLRAERIQSKIKRVFPLFHSRPRALLARGLSMFLPSDETSNRTHVISSLRASDIFSDNLELNEKLNLGMEKYPTQYFGE